MKWEAIYSLSSLVEGLSLLGAYEDSDEEESGNVRTSATNSQHNQSADIDSTLANFMAVSIIFSTILLDVLVELGSNFEHFTFPIRLTKDQFIQHNDVYSVS